MSNDWSFEPKTVELPSGKVALIESGSGSSIVYLHHSWGSPGALPFHEKLVEQGNRVVIPDMPGWGGSDRPTWARDVRDVAILVGRLLDRIDCVPSTIIGAGLGGFVAAELATMSPSRFSSLVLFGPVGLLPEQGEILDQMMLSHRKYIEESFRDRETYIEHFGEEPAPEMRQLWDLSREMTARVSWKPYLHNRRLQPLLDGTSIPTLIVMGEQDRVVPLSVASQFLQALPNAQMEIVPDAGHLVELEQPEAVARLVLQHMKSTDT